MLWSALSRGPAPTPTLNATGQRSPSGFAIKGATTARSSTPSRGSPEPFPLPGITSPQRCCPGLCSWWNGHANDRDFGPWLVSCCNNWSLLSASACRRAWQGTGTALGASRCWGDDNFVLARQALYREAFGTLKKLMGADHLEVAAISTNLGHVLARMRTDSDSPQRLAEAEQLVREGLASRRRNVGTHHPSTVASLVALGDVLARQRTR